MSTSFYIAVFIIIILQLINYNLQNYIINRVKDINTKLELNIKLNTLAIERINAKLEIQ